MKKTLLSLLTTVVLFASCKKDDDPATFIQLQKIENEDAAYNFQYNDQHLPTKIEVLSPADESATTLSLTRYVTFTYENGVPVKAEVYRKEGVMYRNNVLSFSVDGQNRIVKATVKFLNPDGSEYRTQVRDFSFSNDGKLTKIVYDQNLEDAWKFEYDANGNYKESPYMSDNPPNKYENSTEIKYDNGINPFAVNGLGLFMMVAFDGDLFDADVLLSDNFPISNKYVTTYTYTNPSNQQKDITTYTDLNTFVITRDENGGIRKIDNTFSSETKFNGTVQDSDSRTTSINVTCVKKNR
ncbi:MAG: hypothetical protein J7578_07385 [Chitinophagaceae bacterium]|nr:hypothetical protein [Chitinophagaceae bacterium]